MPKEIVVLSGAVSPEREVSLRSGRRMAQQLSKFYSTRLVVLDCNKLPKEIIQRKSLIFPMIHGTFGEDGQLQNLLDEEGYVYVGSGAESMRLTIDKSRTKIRATASGIPVLSEILLANVRGEISFENACAYLKSKALFLKPCRGGSSIHCHRIRNTKDWNTWVRPAIGENWMLEPLCHGKDLTIGMLHGEPLAIMHVVPSGEFLDYEAKCCVGRAQHICPASIGQQLTEHIQRLSRTIFFACDCRDWARIDFILQDNGEVYFLEINGIPGFTETSFYPDSAIAAGISVEDLVCKIVNHSLHTLSARW